MGLTLSYLSAWMPQSPTDKKCVAVVGFRTDMGQYEAYRITGPVVIELIGNVTVAEKAMIDETVGSAIGMMSLDVFPGDDQQYVNWRKFPDSFIIEQGLKKFIKREDRTYREDDDYEQLYAGIYDPHGDGFVIKPAAVELPPEEEMPVRSRFSADDGSYAARLREKRSRAERQEAAEAAAEVQAKALNDGLKMDRLRKGRETPEEGDKTGTIRLEAPGAANGTKVWSCWAEKLTDNQIAEINRQRVAKGKAEDLRPWQVNVRFGSMGGSTQTREVGRAWTRAQATTIRNKKADAKDGSTRDGATYRRVY